MKVQIEHLDLIEPIPKIRLRKGYAHLRLFLRIANQPIAQISVRPRGGVLRPSILLRRVARSNAFEVMRVAMTAGLLSGEAKRLPAARTLGKQQDLVHPFENRWNEWVKFTRTKVLGEQGLQAPYRQWVLAEEARLAAEVRPGEWPRVTVLVCTADRAHHIGACIDSLQKLQYPDYEILIVDDSREPQNSRATREIAQQKGVRYLRIAERGLCCAKNAGIEAARSTWVACTDDDCRPHPNWLVELVRPTRKRPSCMCVTGLVLPAQLESDAELTFESYGGLGRGFYPKCYNRAWFRHNRAKPPRTWDIGAGASMLLRRAAVRAMGGFDVDIGPGRPAACSEDTDIYYRVLFYGRTIEYTPRAVVDHYHRCDASSLTRQIHNYAKGHAAYHLRCAIRYGDYRSLLWLVRFLPQSLRWRMRHSWHGRSRYPMRLIAYEIHGTIVGPWLYARTKVRRWVREAIGRFAAKLRGETHRDVQVESV